MGIHDGHRGRVKRRFLANGLDGFDEHTMLELLLFYSIPRAHSPDIRGEAPLIPSAGAVAFMEEVVA